MNIFEQATKTKLRFTSLGGAMSVEDVWDLPLTSRHNLSLDNLAKSVNRKIKDSEEESFVVKKSSASQVLKLQFDIVKHIIEVKLAEKEAKETAVKRKQEREQLLEALAKKEYQDIEGKSVEEIQARLAELSD